MLPTTYSHSIFFFWFVSSISVWFFFIDFEKYRGTRKKVRWLLFIVSYIFFKFSLWNKPVWTESTHLFFVLCISTRNEEFLIFPLDKCAYKCVFWFLHYFSSSILFTNFLSDFVFWTNKRVPIAEVHPAEL